MKNNRLRILLLAVASAALILVGAIVVAAQEHSPHESDIKVGKKGEVTFNSETKVGDLTFKQGRYALQHRVEGSDHFVHFTELSPRNPYHRSSPTPTGHPGEVPCKLETQPSKVSQTTIVTNKEDGENRVVRVLIAGENVAHLF